MLLKRFKYYGFWCQAPLPPPLKFQGTTLMAMPGGYEKNIFKSSGLSLEGYAVSAYLLMSYSDLNHYFFTPSDVIIEAEFENSFETLKS